MGHEYDVKIKYARIRLSWTGAGVVGVAERNCLQVYLQDNEEAEERSETERYWPLSNTRCDKSVLG